jgi:hypothetical protein
MRWYNKNRIDFLKRLIAFSKERPEDSKRKMMVMRTANECLFYGDEAEITNMLGLLSNGGFITKETATETITICKKRIEIGL